jgi:hypothetical protein
MEVTAAHEYNHVLQFGYDVQQDSWMFESTAVWMEDKVYDDVNDYVSYLDPWAQLTEVPLTSFNTTDSSDPLNVKVYGDAVWNRWIDERYGQDAIRTAWERSRSTHPPSFAARAYDASLATHATSFFEAFTRFAADTAEWRTGTAFEEGSTFADVVRATQKTLAPGAAGVSGHLDHTAYALVNVARTSDARIKLVGSLKHGTAGALALVGRVGSATGGSVDVAMRRLPHGGTASVALADPARYARITAVLVNADASANGFLPDQNDWNYTKDGRSVTALVSNDFTPPTIAGRAPRAGRLGVSRSSGVSVRFSESVNGVSSRTLRLIGPGGHKVSARVVYDKHKARARLVPKHRLGQHSLYKVEISGGVMDRGGNRVPASARSWRFTTG